MNFKSYMEINFNQPELNLLCDALTNEMDRWGDFCLSPNTTVTAKGNYENDMIKLDRTLSNTKYYIGDLEDAKLLLNSVDIGFIIEALDNEIKLENNQLLKNLRDRLKNETLSTLGDRFLKMAHYDRNIKQ